MVNIPFDKIDSIPNFDFSEFAAFVFEPGNSSSLIRYPNNDFIKSIAMAIKKHNGLLMSNEVTTGFGRTGKWFGFQHYDYQSDIVSLGKALGNGYPISGVVISSDVSELFRLDPFRYAQSHQNDPLGCAVGLEVIKEIEAQDLIHKAAKKGEHFRNKLINLKTKYADKILEIRARGLMIAIELNTPDKAELLYHQLIEHGYLVGLKEKTIRFMPPLVIELQQIDNLIVAIDKIIKTTTT